MWRIGANACIVWPEYRQCCTFDICEKTYMKGRQCLPLLFHSWLMLSICSPGQNARGVPSTQHEWLCHACVNRQTHQSNQLKRLYHMFDQCSFGHKNVITAYQLTNQEKSVFYAVGDKAVHHQFPRTKTDHWNVDMVVMCFWALCVSSAEHRWRIILFQKTERIGPQKVFQQSHKHDCPASSCQTLVAMCSMTTWPISMATRPERLTADLAFWMAN